MFELGKEQSVTVGSKKWRLGKMKLSVLFGFRDWVKEQEGDPYEDLDRFIERLPPQEAFALLKEAKETVRHLKSFSLACPLAQRYLSTELGSTKIIQLMLQVNHPDASEEDAFELSMHLVQTGQLNSVIEKASGNLEGNAPGAGGNPPNGEAATSTGTRSSAV